MVNEVVVIPYELCRIREENLVRWPFTYLEDMLMRAHEKNLSILKIHSHPTGYEKFSDLDDFNDKDVFRSFNGWLDHEEFNASAVMLPDGRIFGRFVYDDLSFHTISRILIAGDKLQIWDYNSDFEFNDFELRNVQVFGTKTIQQLKKLSAVVVGCSGTGSPVIEQLVRLGIGKVFLIDPDRVEQKNLNRIINSTSKDAKKKRKKVEVLRQRIQEIGLGTNVEISDKNICDSKELLKEISTYDVVFGCTDTIESRHFLNRLSTYFILPYFDLGVKLVANKEFGIEKIAGAIHYLQPKGSSLLSRGVYDLEQYEANRMARKNPQLYQHLRKEGYIKNASVEVDSPAVISVNMQIAAIGVNEFLNKIHYFKSSSIGDSAIIRMAITDDLFENSDDGKSDNRLLAKCGLGETTTFLGIIGLQ
ncbi:MAG: HesA/MoeB/ThiF family protein [Ginsengibacter sp.]